MSSLYILKRAVQAIIIFWMLFLSVQVEAQNCTWSGKGQGVVEPSNRCAPYDIEYYVYYTGLDPLKTNQIQINWGEGPNSTYTLTQVGPRFEITLNHSYPVGPKPCNYIISAKLIVNGESCDGSEQNQFIYVWDKDDVLGPIPLVVVPEEHQICAGNEVSVTFADQTIFDCIDPTDPNNLGRWIQWEYGTANTITGDVKINGNVETLPFKNTPTHYPRTSLASNEITLPITVPKTSKTGEFFELTLNNWNSCNPYDTDGNAANDPENAPVTKKVYIRIIDAPDADFTINPNPACLGNPVSYTNSSTPGLQYLWEFHDGSTSTAYNPSSKTYNALGAFQDKLIVTDNTITGNTGTCYTEVIKDITIIEQPVASFTISPTGEVCGNTPVTLTNSSLNTPAGTTWKWEIRKNGTGGQQVDLNGANISGYASTNGDIVTNLPYIGSSATATYYVRLIAETPNTCNNTSSWQTIVVKANVATPSFTSPTILRCQGAGTTQYTANANYATNYLWELTPASAGTIDASGLVTWDASFSGTATVTVTAEGCGTPKEKTVSVSVTPVVGVPNPISGSTNVCQGAGTTNYSTSAANAVDYTWSISGAGNTITGTGTTATVNWDPSFTGTATITVRANGCNGASTPVSLDVTVKPVPQLSNSDYLTSICSGELAEFDPTSTLAGSNFKWTTTIDPNLTGVTDVGTNKTIGIDKISDILNNSNDITEKVIYHITPYKNGCDGETKDFVVSVSPAKPADAGVIAGTNLLCEKESGLIYNLPSIKNATDYIWTLPVGAVITSGSNTREITVDFSSTAPGNHVITVYGQNSCGTGGTASYNIEIKPTPVLSANAAFASICTGDDAVINLSSIPSANYSWRVISKGSNISGSSEAENQNVTEIRQQLFNSGSVQQNITYRVNPILNGCAGNNENITIAVNPSPVVVINPAATVICSGSQTNISLSSGTPDATFSWTVVESSPMGATNGNGNLISQTLTNTTFTDQTVTYTITPNSNSCDGSSESITITVKPTPDLSIAVANNIICSKEQTDIALSSSVSGTTFSWTAAVSDPGLAGAVLGDGNAIQQILTNNTNTNQTVTYNIVPTANGCSAPGQTTVITVKPKPVLNVTVVDPQICSGADADIAISSNIVGANISWTVTTSSASVTGASNGSGANILQTLTNSSNTIQSVTYHITAEADGCSAENLDVVITVFPKPELTATAVNSTICNGQKAEVNFTSTVTGTSFNWTVGTIPVTITGAMNGSGNKISQIINNSGITNEQVTYKIIPSANGCQGDEKEAIITVKPSVSKANAGSDNAICGLYYDLSANVPQVGSGKWAKADGPGAVSFSDDLNPTAQVFVSTAGTYTFSWTISNDPCETSIDYVEITFKEALITSDILGPDEVCVNSKNVLYQVISNPGSTYDWRIEPALNAPTVKFGGSPINMIALDFGGTAWTGDLIVTETNNGCQGAEKKVNIISYPLPIANAGPDKIACQDTPIMIGATPSASGGSGIYNYVWFPSSGLDDSYTSNPMATINLDRTYTLRVTDVVTGCVSLDDAVSITVEEPLIPGTINSDQTICEGTKPTPFTEIPASGGDGTYSYQWQTSSDGINFNDISGAISASFVENQLSTTTTFYRRKVSGGQCGEKYSNTIKVTVQAPIQPGSIGSDQIILVGSTPAILTNEASAIAESGITIQYQWQQATDPDIVFSSISGANSETYQPGPLHTKTYFRRRVSGGVCGVVYSNTVTVNVEPPSLPGKIGTDQIICINSIPQKIFEVEPASGVSASEEYRWMYSENGIDFYDIPGETGREYTPTAPIIQTTQYRRDYKSGVVGSWVYSNVITVTVQSTIDPGIIQTNQIICEGGDPAIFTSAQTPQGGSGVYQYQWKKSNSPTGVFTNIFGATDETYNPPSGLTSTTYYVRQVSGGPCPAQLTSPVEVLVEPTLTGGSILANQTVCFESVPNAFTNLTEAQGGSGSYAYQWQFKIGTGSFMDITGADEIAYAVTDPMNYTTTYRRKVSAGACAPAYSNEITVTVQPTLIAGNIAGDQTVCYNSDPGLIMSISLPFGGAGTGTYQYQWKYSHDNINFYDINGATASSYDPPAGITQTTYYIREVRSGVCDPQLSNVVAKTVQPTLLAGEINGETTICRGSQPGLLGNVTSASGGDGNYYYQWQWSSTMGGPYADISGADDESFQPGNLVGTTYYVRKVTAGVCEPQISNEIKVTVDQPINPGSIGGEQIICYGSTPAAFGQTPASGGNGVYNFQWESSPSLSGPFVAISGATSAAYAVTNPMLETTYFRRKVSAGICGSSYTDVIKIVVDDPVNPGAVGDDQTIPVATVPALFVEKIAATGGNGVNYQYQWQASQDPLGPFGDVYGATQKDFQAGAVFMTTYFRRMVRSGQCPPEYTNLITVIAEEKPDGGFIGIGSNQHICEGEVPGQFEEITGASGGDGANYDYQWQSSLSQYIGYTNIPGATDAEFTPTAPLSATTYFRRQVNSGVNPPSYSNVVKVTVDPTPFAGVVGDDQIICENGKPNLFLAVEEAKGALIEYQWKASTTKGGPYTDIFLANSKLYQAPAGLTETTYYVREINTGVCGTFLSNEIEVKVEPTLIAGTITGDQTICEGTSATSLQGGSAAGGTGNYAYQWKYSDKPGGPYLDVAGGDQDNYSVPDFLTKTTYFRRMATSVGGVCTSVLSNEIKVTVEPALQAGQIGGSDRICEGGNTKPFTSDASPTGGNNIYEYQWMTSENPGGPYQIIEGATGETYKAPNGLNTMTYYVREVKSGQCQAKISNEVHIKVDATLFPGVVAYDQTIQIGGDPVPFIQTEQVTGGGDTYSFQWQWSHVINGIYEDIPFATSIDYDVPPMLLQTTYYRRKVTSGVCGSKFTDPLTITVITDLTPGTIGNNNVVCHGNTPDPLVELTRPTGGNGTYTYQWKSSPVKSGPFTNIDGANGKNYEFTSGMIQTTYYVREVRSGIFPPVIGDTVSIVVLPELTPGSIRTAGASEMCVGDQPSQLTIETAPSGGTLSYQYQWLSSSTIDGTYTDIPFAREATYQPPTGLNETKFFMRKVVSGTCEAVYTNKVGIVVNPLPEVALTSSSPNNIICKGDEVTFTATGATQYRFYINDLPVDESSISNKYVTTSLSNGDYAFALGTDSKGCKAYSNQIATKVNNLPTATLTDTASICLGDQVNLDLTLTGKAPFQVVYGDGTQEITRQNLSYNNVLTVKPLVSSTYSLISVKDDNGCFNLIQNEKTGVYVDSAVAKFSASALSGCSPSSLSFTNENIKPGITYSWSWGDGTRDDVTTPTSAQVISHTFSNLSFYNNAIYQVRLTAMSDALGCTSTQTKSVTIYPSMELAVEIDKNEGCAPLPVSFKNNSRGVNIHRWYYRIKGTTSVNEVLNVRYASYILPNKTTEPIVYEIIYEAGSANCQAEPLTFEVTVYPELNAKFDVAPDTLEFPNTTFSIINQTNVGNWDYTWEFGDGKTASKSNNPNTYSYETFGSYEIYLKVENAMCKSEYKQLVYIDPGEPLIDFECSQISGCRPLKVNFHNLSKYAEEDSYVWNFGDNAGTSARIHPEYTFTEPGHYFVTLTGSNFLGITKTKTLRIDVYDNPIADFNVRPNQVKIPDEPIHLTNLSWGAEEYYWDFGDGKTSNEFEPVHYYETAGDFDLLLIAETKEGCTDTMIVAGATLAIDGDRLKIPNVFTPSLNGPTGGKYVQFDHSNDVFLPLARGVVEFHMRIFNKWGELIFESNDKEIGWDGYYKGQICPQDIYVYKLKIKFSNGKHIEQIGDITLLK